MFSPQNDLLPLTRLTCLQAITACRQHHKYQEISGCTSSAKLKLVLNKLDPTPPPLRMTLDLKTDELAVCWAPLLEYPGLSILSDVVSSSQGLSSSSSMQTTLTEAQPTNDIYNSNVALDKVLDKCMHFPLIKKVWILDVSPRMNHIVMNTSTPHYKRNWLKLTDCSTQFQNQYCIWTHECSEAAAAIILFQI